MNQQSVSILIATRNRHEDLADTLSRLHCCRDMVVELVVVDDGSEVPVESTVRREWPEAIVVRHEQNAGQCQRRSEGFFRCSGQYILQLDDDSSPVCADTLRRAVAVLEARPEVALLAFHIFNGADLPSNYVGRGDPRYTAGFVGCGALIRTQAVQRTGGYTVFFSNEWEEEELSLRLMKAGWALYYDPALVVHHRISPKNRRTERTWKRGFRNKLWALVMHFPALRVFSDGAWVLTLACWDAVRLLRFRMLLEGLWECAVGLPRALALRAAMSAVVVTRYDALRFRGIRTREEFQYPPKVSIAQLWRWFTSSWWNRARQRSIWDRTKGDVGTSPTAAFSHERQHVQ